MHRSRIALPMSLAVIPAGTIALMNMPGIDWRLDDAKRQTDVQADDFEIAMVHNLRHDPDLFRDSWPRGTGRVRN